MDQEQREGVVVGRALVDEMDRLAVDARAEVRKLVEPGLLRSPVVVVAPVLDQLTQVVDRDPAGMGGLYGIGRSIGRPRLPQGSTPLRR